MNLLNPGRLELVDFKIQDSWAIAVDVSGLGVLDLIIGWIKALLTDFVETTLKDSIITILEDTVKENIQNILSLLDVSSLLTQFISDLNLPCIPPEILGLVAFLLPGFFGVGGGTICI